MTRISIEKLAVRKWSPDRVVDGIYIPDGANPLNFADYAYAVRNQRGTVAELWRYLGRENVRKLANGTVSHRHKLPPLIIISGATWEITASGIQRYSESWDAQGLR